MVKQSTFMLALFAIAFLAISFASATLVIIPSATTANVEQGNSVSFIFKVNNTNITDALLVSFSNVSSNNLKVSISPANSQVSNLSGDFILTVQTSLSTTVGDGYEVILTAQNGSVSDTKIFKINVTKSLLNEICGTSYAPGNISFGDVDDEEKGNEDAWQWRPLDDIELTVNNIENKVDKDVKFDVSLLFYKDGKKISSSNIAEDEDNLLIDNLKINNEDEEDAVFSFKVSGDVKEGNYDAYVKVKGSTGCYVQKISSQITVEQDSNNVIVNDVEGPVSSQCGETVDLSVDISNIGSEDEDQVKVILYNRDLGLSLYKEIENLDSGDTATALFSFVVPQNVAEKTYKLTLSTEFEYDSDDEEYDSESDSADDYIYSLGLLGNCIDPTKPVITAKLNSTAVVGEELVVEVTFKNNGNTSVSAIVAPEEYDSWAEFVKADPTITVGRLESKKVYITLTPTQAGQQTFNLNVIYNGKSIDQPVTLTVTENTSLLDGMYAQLGKTGTYLTLGIGVLVLLILLVLLVKVILTRKH